MNHENGTKFITHHSTQCQSKNNDHSSCFPTRNLIQKDVNLDNSLKNKKRDRICLWNLTYYVVSNFFPALHCGQKIYACPVIIYNPQIDCTHCYNHQVIHFRSTFPIHGCSLKAVSYRICRMTMLFCTRNAVSPVSQYFGSWELHLVLPIRSHADTSPIFWVNCLDKEFCTNA